MRARAWYKHAYGAVAPEPADYFFGVRWSRTEEFMNDRSGTIDLLNASTCQCVCVCAVCGTYIEMEIEMD
jgi:hypothetical protein